MKIIKKKAVVLTYLLAIIACVSFVPNVTVYADDSNELDTGFLKDKVTGDDDLFKDVNETAQDVGRSSVKLSNTIAIISFMLMGIAIGLGFVVNSKNATKLQKIKDAIMPFIIGVSIVAGVSGFVSLFISLGKSVGDSFVK